MRKLVWLLLLMVACSAESELAEQEVIPEPDLSYSDPGVISLKDEFYPEWSWDYINTYGHFSKTGSNLTEQEAELASRHAIVVFERTHGDRTRVGADVESDIGAQLIKKYNPECKVLLYKSSGSDHGSSWSTGSLLDKEETAYMTLVDGEGNSFGTYDYRLTAVQDYYFKSLVSMCSKNLDGFFADGLGNFNEQNSSYILAFGEDGYYSYVHGLLNTLQRFRDYFDGEKFVIGNSLSSRYFDDPTDILTQKYIDGGMIDHFLINSGYEPQAILDDIQIIIECAKRKHICVVKGWPRYTMQNSSTYEGGEAELTQEELEAVMREDMTFPLACFLLGAGEYSYFCYACGWTYDEGGLVDFEEYNKPLGEPLGDYTRGEGWNCYREFKHAKVWVNLETRDAEIIWDVDSE